MEQFHDYRQVHPPLTGPYIGHVGCLYLDFPMYRKSTVQYIGRHRIIVFAAHGGPELSLSFGKSLLALIILAILGLDTRYPFFESSALILGAP